MAGTTALGLSRELRTQPVRNRPRTSRRGQVEHKPVAMSPASARPPRQAHSQRATSCRNRFLIRDRGSNFTRSFDAVFEATGTTILRSAVQAPRMNAICERLVGTLRRELLDRVLIVGEAHLRAVLAEYQVHYNTARPHQGIAQRVPADERDAHPATVTDVDTRQIRRKPVLDGLINEYVHAA
jgi:putative transposase